MINNNSDEAVFVDSVPDSSVITSTTGYGRNPVGKGPVDIEVMYINNLPFDVVVVDRTGFRHKVPKVMWGYKGKFIIRTLYTINELAFNDCKHLFAGFRGTPSKDLEIIKKAVLINMEGYPQRMITVGIDHSVDLDDFQRVDGSMYIREVDMVVSSLSLDKAPSHPFAMGSISENNFKETIGKDRKDFSFGMGIEMVNRAHGAQPMYTYCMQSVKKIPVSLDYTRPEGFYITTLDKDFTTTNEQKLETHFFELQDAKKLGIYKSEEETVANGDIKLLWERQISELKHNSEIMKIKFSEAKSEYEEKINKQTLEQNARAFAAAEELRRANAQLAETERLHQIKLMQMKEQAAESARRHEEFLKNYATIDQERDRAHKERVQSLDREREALKDKYDKRSYDRRDFSDQMKIILATVTTMGAIILTYNKTFGKDTK